MPFIMNFSKTHLIDDFILFYTLKLSLERAIKSLQIGSAQKNSWICIYFKQYTPIELCFGGL